MSRKYRILILYLKLPKNIFGNFESNQSRYFVNTIIHRCRKAPDYVSISVRKIEDYILRNHHVIIFSVSCNEIYIRSADELIEIFQVIWKLKTKLLIPFYFQN